MTASPPEGTQVPEVLDEVTVRSRVRSGVALMAIRGGLLKVVGIVSTFVLAQLLAPRDFGLVAVGFSIIGLATFLGDAGLGTSFIRRAEPPTRRELGALVALQGTVAAVIAAGVTIVALVANTQTMAVAAVMAWSLPLLALRTSGAIMLERDLNYRPQVTVEIVEVVVYNAVAIGTVALGAGVWGVAGATYARAIASDGAMAMVSPVGIVLPSPRFRALAGTLRFGAAFQAANLVTVTRDQVVNFGVAAISGVSVLGLWTISFRLLAIPYLLFESLWRVSFPGMARLLDTGADARPVIERTTGMSATVTGLLLSGLVGTSPILIPALLGEEWRGATEAIPWACLGLMATPISTAAGGYLYAKGDAGTVLRTTIYQAVVMLGIGLGLLPWLGLTALGLGWFVAHVVDGIVIVRGVRRFIEVDVIRPLLGPLLAALLSGGLAWPLAQAVPETILNGILIGLGVIAVYLGVHLLVAREQLASTVRFLRRRG